MFSSCFNGANQLTFKIRQVFSLRIAYYRAIVNSLIVLQDFKLQGWVRMSCNQRSFLVDVV